MSSSALVLATSLGMLGVYSYSMYCLASVHDKREFLVVVPEHWKQYGLFKFLTIQCLLMQLVNSLLHVLAHFVRPLRGARDLVFTTLAYPIGSIVVYTFWLVWFGMGREYIFPAKLDAFYPAWLNHAIHTVIVPVNFLLAVSVNHRYTKNGVLVTLVYLLAYVIFLHVIRTQSGHFVYPYLTQLNDTQRMIYFAATAVFAYVLYKSGQLLRSLAHGAEKSAAATKKPASKGQKQR